MILRRRSVFFTSNITIAATNATPRRIEEKDMVIREMLPKERMSAIKNGYLRKKKRKDRRSIIAKRRYWLIA